MKTLPLLLTALLLVSAPSTVFAAPPPAFAAIVAVASHCAASAEQAARGILGDTGTATNEGYRVQDLVVDPILRKAWVRVADCHDARKPLTLVPLAASLASIAANLPAGTATTAATSMPSTSIPAAGTPSRPAALAPVPPAPTAPVLIARGDAVEILVQSSNVHMTLEGHASAPAAAGESVDVVLDATTSPTIGEAPAPPRHLRGIAAGAHRVEVQQ